MSGVTVAVSRDQHSGWVEARYGARVRRGNAWCCASVVVGQSGTAAGVVPVSGRVMPGAAARLPVSWLGNPERNSAGVVVG